VGRDWLEEAEEAANDCSPQPVGLVDDEGTAATLNAQYVRRPPFDRRS
jgi:hypothetical protein